MEKNLNLKFLRMLAILLPLLFLATVDLVRHFLVPAQLHTWPGFVGTYLLVAGAVVLFAFAVFGTIERLQRQVLEQNEQLQVLNQIATTAGENLDLDALLNRSLDRVMELVGADAGVICSLDTDHDELVSVCSRGFSPEAVARIRRAKVGSDTIGEQAVRTGKPAVFERLFEDPRVAEMARRGGFRSAISVPLKVRGEVTGVLGLAMKTEHDFPPAAVALLTGIGGELGMAMRQATLYERTRRQTEEFGALLAVGRVVTSSIDLTRTLEEVLDQALAATGTEAGEVWLADEARELTLSARRGTYPEAFMERTRFARGEGVPGRVAESGEPLVIHDLDRDPRFLRQAVIDAGFRMFVALPLRRGRSSSGVLCVAARSPEALSRAGHLRLLEGIAEWASIAVENARLHQAVQDAAVVEERERIARELHDSLGQILGSINAQTLAVKKLLQDGRTDVALQELTDMGDRIQEVYADIREAILGLRTASDATREGFVPAVRLYSERFTQMSAIRVELRVTEEAQRALLAPAVQLQLLRVLQEALTNVRKHAHATAVQVALDTENGVFKATVSDDGRGFDPATLPQTGWPHFGLQMMRERAEAVGGGFQIEAGRGMGTVVTVTVPRN